MFFIRGLLSIAVTVAPTTSRSKLVYKEAAGYTQCRQLLNTVTLALIAQCEIKNFDPIQNRNPKYSPTFGDLLYYRTQHHQVAELLKFSVCLFVVSIALYDYSSKIICL